MPFVSLYYPRLNAFEVSIGTYQFLETFSSHFIISNSLPLNYAADAGTLVDSYISGKIMQLKEQVATLEKREER